MATLSLALVSCGVPSPELATSEAPTLRRLTEAQYRHALQDLFGEDLYVPAHLEPDVRVRGLEAVGSGITPISPRGMERFEEASYVIADQVVEEARRAAVVPCTPVDALGEACARQALTEIGAKAWRRPLTTEEVDQLVVVHLGATETLGDFWQGLSFGIAALLQSPDFMMRPEFGVVGDDGVRRYTGYEMASRLSFLFWNSIPDAELTAAAASGELETAQGVDAQAQRMWASERSKDGVRAWATDLLHLNDLDGLRKDPLVFEHMSDEVGASAREETLQGIEHVVFEDDGDFREIVRTRRTFVDRTLAAIYNVQAPAREGFAETELPENLPRRGLLGQVSVLALHSHAVSSSPTLRGQFVREALLCQPLPDPPAGVDTSIPASTSESPTLRDRVQRHLEEPGCASCHELTDRIGLGLESFDGMGVYRTIDGGALIDASGDLDGVPFEDAAKLADALFEHERFAPCLVKQVTRYALGRAESEGEEPVIEWLTEQFAKQDHRMQPLWLDLVVSPVFRQVGGVSE